MSRILIFFEISSQNTKENQKPVLLKGKDYVYPQLEGQSATAETSLISIRTELARDAQTPTFVNFGRSEAPRHAFLMAIKSLLAAPNPTKNQIMYDPNTLKKSSVPLGGMKKPTHFIDSI
ncbi:hypothetical protein OAG43_01800 [Verrucomicrobia bacterium]|nr:hypothetical protein [Verrucomicrobiota bacterium]